MSERVFFSLFRLSRRACDDLCWLWFPHDLPAALQLWRRRIQLPDRRFWSPVGSAHAGLVPLVGPQHRQNLYWHREVRNLFFSLFILSCRHTVF